MKELKYIRTGKTIKNIQDGTIQGFKSVNKAKKHSSKLQISEDGGLGMGSLAVYI